MGDAGTAEGCKVAQLVAFAEGCVLSEKPWKLLDQDGDGMENNSGLVKQCI